MMTRMKITKIRNINSASMKLNMGLSNTGTARLLKPAIRWNRNGLTLI
jgi:hypothetical protein